MTYPLRQRTFHEFLNYLHNVRVHCCARRAVKHYRMSLIKNIINAIWAVNHREKPSRIKWSTVTFSAARPLPSTLHFLFSLNVCASAFVSFIAKPHRIFKTHMLRLSVSHAHTHARAHTLGPVAEVWLRLKPVKMARRALFVSAIGWTPQ